jgi:regulator of cell morphogenesis and NO signaling
MLVPGKYQFQPQTKMIDLLNRNYALLLFLQHFGVDFNVGNRTVHEICEQYGIDEPAFITIGNLYNGILPRAEEIGRIGGVDTIVRFLKASHLFYKDDKYPEIMDYLAILHKNHQSQDIVLLEQFFKDYFREVLDHLEYEEEVAFPYFNALPGKEKPSQGKDYSASEYREHHTDIETKLEDLKNLLLKHINISGDMVIRRKFLNSLFGLEFDLKVHAMVEELILIPLAEKMETR